MLYRALTIVSVLALVACNAEPAPSEAASEATPQAGAEPAVPTSEPTEAAPTARVVEASATQCREGERALYNCPFDDGRVASVCAGEQIAYRFGPLGDPEIEISRVPGQDGVWQGGVVGQGGGQQTHVRFRNGEHDYIVFSGYDGSLADNPGREYSGVAVMRGREDVRRLDCPVTSHQTEIAAAMIPQAIPQETVGGDYDAWF